MNDMAGDHSYIKLIVKTPNGTRSEMTIKSPGVTDVMLQAAYELLYATRAGKLCDRDESKKAVASLNPPARKASDV